MASASPEISIIIPVYNDPDGIRQTLESLLSAISGRDAAVIVVDNGSTDNTPAVIQSYCEKYANVSLISEREIQGSYAARNAGIRRSESDVLAFLDADMTVPANWLDAVFRVLNTREESYIGCNVELALPDRPTIAARFDYHTGFPIEEYIQHQHFAPTCGLLVHRSLFEDVGLFDHRLISGGDKEFGKRVFDAGYELHFAEEVTMFHPTRNRLRDLARKDVRVGRGLCQLQRYHPSRFGSPGMPPRPSGVKRPPQSISIGNRLVFGVLGTILTGMRGFGYLAELAAPTAISDSNHIPTID